MTPPEIMIIAGFALSGLTAVAFRHRFAYWLRVAKALTTDRRLPRGLRWAIRAGLAVKMLPVDFGLDELILGTCAVLLATVYRSRTRAIIAEIQR